MMIKRSIILLLIALVTVSCGKKKEPTKRNTLNLNLTVDPPTLDPRKGADFTSTTMHYLLFEGLTRMTPYSTVAPALAERIEVSEDQLTYTFHLRDAQWSNGMPISAYDFVQTWRDMLNPNFPCPNAHLLYPIKNAEQAKTGQVSERQIGIRALDHRTMKVYLEQPTPFFLEMISFCVFSPVNQHIAVRNPQWADKVDQTYPCNGPFRLKRWKRGSEIVVEKNPYYWDRDNVDLESIHFSIIENELTALKMYEKDELDIMGIPFTGIPSDSVPSLLDKGLLKTASLPASTICCFNMEEFPFNNVNIRKAFAYAINRKEIVENITQMNEDVGLQMIPQILLDNQPGPFFVDGDQENAKFYFQKGLRELGIEEENLKPIRLLHAVTGIYPRVAQALQEQWRKVLGVQVKLQGYEYKVFLDKLSQKDFQISQCIWVTQYHDPMNILERFQNKLNCKNYPGYESERYSELLNQSLYFSDREERYEVLREAISVLMEDMPLTPIFHWNNMYMQKPYVKNLLLKPSGYFHLNNIFINNENKMDEEDNKL